MGEEHPPRQGRSARIRTLRTNDRLNPPPIHITPRSFPADGGRGSNNCHLTQYNTNEKKKSGSSLKTNNNKGDGLVRL